jgi:hypothetical protein
MVVALLLGKTLVGKAPAAATIVQVGENSLNPAR